MDKVIIGQATLYHGDCLEILPTLDKVDAVVTDPPYGIGTWSVDGGGNKKYTLEEISDLNKWDAEAPKEAIQAAWLMSDQSVFWGGNYFAGFLGACKAPLVWDKTTRGMHLHECEIAWTKGIQGTTRIFTGVSNQKFRDDPTQKSQAVMEWCVNFTSGSVLDPFMGSGTTGVACANLGRQFIGIEIERKYFDIACERIEWASAQGRLFA